MSARTRTLGRVGRRRAENALMTIAPDRHVPAVLETTSVPCSWAASRPARARSRRPARLLVTEDTDVQISRGRRRVMAATAVGLIWRAKGRNTNPRASAPIATAINASSSLVMPQIFTHTVRPAQADPRRRPSGQASARAPRRPAHRRTRVSRARRRPRARDARFGDFDHPGGTWRASRAARSGQPRRCADPSG